MSEFLATNNKSPANCPVSVSDKSLKTLPVLLAAYPVTFKPPLTVSRLPAIPPPTKAEDKAIFALFSRIESSSSADK